MIAPARVAAYDVLRAVSSGRADLPAALAHARTRLHDERDRGLAGEIATGTLRWQGAFDHIVQVFTKRPLGRLDPEVLDILRLTVFQLLHLDRVPASAAVNDAVNLVRKAGKKSAGPLVNAVLRRVSRERTKLPLPPRPEQPGDREAHLDYLSITLSHPRWLVSRWLDRYGFDATEAWCRFDNAPAALTLRVNTLKASPDEAAASLRHHGVDTHPGHFAPDALIVDAGNPVTTDLHGTGLFVVQDEASQLVALFSGARSGERIFDGCASPGGKTTGMAAAMRDTGLIVAADVRGRRVQLLAETVRASGARCVRVIQADARQPLPFSQAFDCVLVDAPCSGLGTLRRDPDIRWRRAPEELASLAGNELRILASAADAVRTGGRLVYATCSSEPDENEDVMRAFLDAHRNFRPQAAAGLGGSFGGLINESGHLRTYPFRDELEAFFAASVVKHASLG
jgi:16S rRNA (cytosine967-C5)-methyltransferase